MEADLAGFWGSWLGSTSSLSDCFFGSGFLANCGSTRGVQRSSSPTEAQAEVEIVIVCASRLTTAFASLQSPLVLNRVMMVTGGPRVVGWENCKAFCFPSFSEAMRVGGIAIFVNSLCYLAGVHVKGTVHVPCLQVDRMIFCKLCGLCGAEPEVEVSSLLCGPLFVGCIGLALGPGGLSSFGVCGLPWLMWFVHIFGPLGEFISICGMPIGLVLKCYLFGCSGTTPMAVCVINGPIRLGHVVGSINGSFLGNVVNCLDMEGRAFAIYFQAQKIFIQVLGKFDELDHIEIHKIDGDFGALSVMGIYESNSPFMKRMLVEGSTSVCSSLLDVLCHLLDVVRVFPWDLFGPNQDDETSTVRELKSLAWSYALDFIFLSELKVDAKPLVRILNKLHFYFHFSMPVIGTAGGIILAWKSRFDFESISCSRHHISGLVYSDPPSNLWLLFCVYGPPYFHAKNSFWTEIMREGERFGGPWLIVGDTNFVLKESERKGSKGRDQFIPFISSLVNSNGLINLPIQGDQLTWDNHRSGVSHVKSALDKGIVNGDWIKLFPKAILRSVQTCNSDHRPLCLSFGRDVEKFRRTFRFEEGWTRDERSKLVVSQAWNSVVHNWAPARIFKKIGATRVALIHWHKTQYGKVDASIKDLECKLNTLQRLPVGSRDWKVECEVRKALNEALERREIYWKQRARVSWLREGDKCSKFFFLSATIRGRRNAIESILDSNNVWLTRRSAIGNEFTRFLKDIFTDTGSGSGLNCSNMINDCLSPMEKEELVKAPDYDEIRRTLFAMGSNKAPGPDGMSVTFFKHYWEAVGDDFCEVVSDFFFTCVMHKGVNATNLVLIPKVQNPKRTNHFRPISLCNVSYKVISKIIANRIKPILPRITSLTQSAFVPGRNIQDNNVIVQEIIHSFKRKQGKGGFFAIKIDLVKAYDKIRWQFIDHVLYCFDVPPMFRNWISQCISTTSLSVCLNGGQILSRLLEEALRSGNIKGISPSRGGPILTHIFFADDLILVGRASVVEAKKFWQCLENFCAESGQQVNKLKTSIFFSNNTPVGVRKEIKEALGIGSSDGNVKYLGLPLFRSKQKDADFNFIQYNLTSKLQGWKAKLLSKAGRATLIKSVGLSLPMYAMQTTKLSNRLVTRIDGMVCDFWWGFEKGNHGLHLKAWDKLCLPKSRGGLGFRKTKEMNLAFLAKWGWNLLTGSQSLCCRILEAKYLKGKELFHCKYKDSDSWFWKNVVKATNILRQGACKVVSDGKDTRIWKDPWVMHGKSFIPKSNGSSSDGFNKVADIITSDGKWDIQKLTSLFDQDTIAAILKGGHPSGNGFDKWIWTKDHNRRFSCKSAYLIQAL
uniref:Reverse transcriptase domain-containing protein n=1 Tax=Cannabis sativa TaxID=3483 RepID=A0A803QEG0_CANSA